MCAVFWGQRNESALLRVLGLGHNADSLYEVANELVGSDTARLSCHQFRQTLTGFRLAYILRGVGFQETASE